MTITLTPEQQDRVLDLLTELAREGGAPTGRRRTRSTRSTEYPYKDGKQEVREEVARRCASLLREIRGYV